MKNVLFLNSSYATLIDIEKPRDVKLITLNVYDFSVLFSQLFIFPT